MTSKTAPTEIRAAFDLGSSQHKMSVAAVTAHSLTVLHSASIRVPLADALHLSADAALPPHVLRASHAAVRELRASALAFGVSRFSAVATHVFRVATNGAAHLAALAAAHALPVVVVSACDEGVLALATVSFSSLSPSDPASSRPHSGDAATVAWDCGGGSSQLCTRLSDTDQCDMPDGSPFAVHALPFGSSAVRAVFANAAGPLRRRVAVLSSWVCARARATPIQSPVLSARLRAHHVRAVGGATSMFALASARVANAVLRRRDIAALVRATVDRYSAEELQDCDEVVAVLPKLVLLLQLMIAYDVRSVRYVPGNGNCVGLLSSNDARFWNPLSTDATAPPRSLHVGDPAFTTDLTGSVTSCH